MHAVAGTRIAHHLWAARPAVNAATLEVLREVGRAAAAVAAVLVWGALLLLLA